MAQLRLRRLRRYAQLSTPESEADAGRGLDLVPIEDVSRLRFGASGFLTKAARRTPVVLRLLSARLPR